MKRYALLVLLAAGCGAKEPYPTLPGGSEAYVFSADEPEVKVGTARGEGMIGLDFEVLTNGTKVRVLDDPGKASDADRPVRASVREGKHEGLAVTVGRRLLRPIGG